MMLRPMADRRGSVVARGTTPEAEVSWPRRRLPGRGDEWIREGGLREV